MNSSKNILNLNIDVGESNNNNGVDFSINPGSDEQVARYEGNTSISPSGIIINDNDIMKLVEGISLKESTDTGIGENRLMTNANGSLVWKGKELLRVTDGEFGEDSALVIFDGINGNVRKGQNTGEWSDTLTFLSNGDGLSGSPTSINVFVLINYFEAHANIIINRFIEDFSSINFYTSFTAIPVGFRPLGEVLIPFIAILGTSSLEADILAVARISTAGIITIDKDASGSGSWNSPNQGWSYISGSYFIG